MINKKRAKGFKAGQIPYSVWGEVDLDVVGRKLVERIIAFKTSDAMNSTRKKYFSQLFFVYCRACKAQISFSSCDEWFKG